MSGSDLTRAPVAWNTALATAGAGKTGKTGKPASSSFDYSGPFTETVLMRNLAVRYPNHERKDANAYVRRESREGWKLPAS